MKIVVTGGAGFIGGNFVYYMLKKRPEDTIICLDKLTYAGNMETMAEAMKNDHFKFVRADIADRKAVYELFETEKPDVIVNFAAESHVDRSIENPEIFLQTNVIGTSVLLDACRKYGIKRYHQVSTDEVYGDLPLDRPDFNIGGHNERANIDVVKTILKQLGKSEDLIEYVGDRKGHDRRYAIDPTKIHNELGWLPETKFEDGIKATVQWYLDNRQWWENIISDEYQDYYDRVYGNKR